MSWMDEGARVLQVLVMLPLVLFLATYVGVVPAWRRSNEGRHLVASNVAFLAILALGLVAILLGKAWTTWPGRGAVRLAVYALLFLVFSAQYILLLSALRRRQRALPLTRSKDAQIVELPTDTGGVDDPARDGRQ